QQVRRFYEQGEPVADLLYDEAAFNTRWQARRGGEWHDFDADAEHIEMLKPIFRDGKLVYDRPQLTAIRDYAQQQFAEFTERPEYPVLADRYLEESTRDLRDWLAHRDDTQYSEQAGSEKAS